MTTITTRTLACGATLAVERIESVRSAAVTWLVPGGSAYDPPDREGRSTLWSELLQRGCGDLDSRAFADAMDRLGAIRSVNVGTYYLQVDVTMLGERVPEVLPLLVRMVRDPRMDETSIEPARDLALQSLKSLKDEPAQRAMLSARQRHWPSPLNRSGMGTEQGLAALSRSELADGWRATAGAARSIIGVAGAVDPEAVFAILEGQLKGWAPGIPEPTVGTAPARGYAHEKDESNQVQVVLVHDAPSEARDESWLEKISVSVLSGGMSGRLFTEVREKRGLCYSVSASYRGERDFGGVTAYVGTTPERAQESLDVLVGELRRISTAPGAVTLDEFKRALVGMKSRLVFSGESTGARAVAIASDQHRLGHPRSLAEIAARLDRVTLEDVLAYLSRRRLGTTTIQTVGPSPLNPARA